MTTIVHVVRPQQIVHVVGSRVLVESVTWLGAWSALTTYTKNDAVSHSGSSYVALTTNTNSAPPSANWTLIASKGADGSIGVDGAQGPQGPQGEQGETPPAIRVLIQAYFGGL